MAFRHKRNSGRRKRSINAGSILMILLSIAAGFVIGLCMTGGNTSVESGGMPALKMAEVLLSFILSECIHVIFHEAGHMVFGLASGYTFSSFRIGSRMLIKSSDGFSWKKLSIAGTGGQCLMNPPDYVNGRFPFILFNLGGILFNVLLSLISFTLWQLTGQSGIPGTFFITSTVCGLFFALSNGIPFQTASVANDGYNTYSMGKDRNAARAFWLQLRINSLLTEGDRLRDMPEEWFVLSPDMDTRNIMISTMAVFRENRYMDTQEFDKAEELIAVLLSDRYRVLGLYRFLLINDRLYIRLIRSGQNAGTDEYDRKDMKSFRKAMKKFPAVIRTEFAYCAIKKQDPAAAQKQLALFEAVKKNYPVQPDIAGEEELIRLAEAAVSSRGAGKAD